MTALASKRSPRKESPNFALGWEGRIEGDLKPCLRAGQEDGDRQEQ